MSNTQDKIIKNRDNAVVIEFSGVDLTLFDRVQASFGEDTRDSLLNPTDVVVASSSELRLKFGDTNETQANYWTIIGFDSANVNGLLLTSRCLGNLNASIICEQP